MLADGWRVDGMIESPESWGTGWHHWDVLPDGTLMIAIAEAADPTAKGAMHAAVARAALAAHSGYRHTPAQLIQRVSDTLWQTNTGEQLVSMIYAHLDPESGDGLELRGDVRVDARGERASLHWDPRGRHGDSLPKLRPRRALAADEDGRKS